MPRRGRGSPRGFVAAIWLCAVWALVPGASARAQSAWDASIERFEVPEGCTGREAFVGRLDALGAVPGAVRVAVEVAASWSGLLRGVVVLTRPDAPPVERAIEDEVCADVLDALAIAAALFLRGEPPRDVPEAAPAAPAPVVEPAVVPPRGEVPPAPVESAHGPRVRVALGGGPRLGLGPVPDFALAPDLFLAVEIDRFVVALHVLGWPESTAPHGAGGVLSPDAPGVALYALGSTLELGARLGDDVAVVPAAVLELGAVVGHGVGVERARTEVALACDAGVSTTVLFELGAVRLFVRADLVFALVQPVYVVGGLAAYQAPIARGTGMVGLAYLFGS